MPGPAPTRNPRRTNARPDWRRLPPGGCTKEAPEWPLPKRMTKAQEALWAQLWVTPQAEAWHDLGWARVIARYCTMIVLSESGGGANGVRVTAQLLGEIRQIEDRIGLTPMAMKRLLWEIDIDPAVSSVGPVEDDDDGPPNLVALFGNGRVSGNSAG